MYTAAGRTHTEMKNNQNQCEKDVEGIITLAPPTTTSGVFGERSHKGSAMGREIRQTSRGAEKEETEASSERPLRIRADTDEDTRSTEREKK